MTPDITIIIAGQDVSSRIKRLLGQSLVSEVTITDEAGGKADQISINVIREGFAPPPAGAPIEAFFGYLETGLTPLGAFKVDEVETSGDKSGGHRIAIKGTAADMASGIKAERTEIYDKKTLGDIAQSVAGRYGLGSTVAPKFAGLKVEKIHQVEESDMHLLTRLAKRFDATFKLADNKVIFTEKGKGLGPDGAPRPPIILGDGDILNYAWKGVKRPRSGKVIAYFHDKGEAKKEKLEAGGGEPIRELKGTFASREEAEEACKAAREGGEDDEATATLDLVGNPAIRAGTIVTLKSGPPELLKAWEAARAEHKFAKSGYTTRVELKRKRP